MATFPLELHQLLRAVQEDYAEQHRLATEAQSQFAASAPEPPPLDPAVHLRRQELREHPFLWLVKRISELTGRSIQEIGAAANRLGTPEGLEADEYPLPPPPTGTGDDLTDVLADALWLRESETSTVPSLLHVYRDLRELDRDGGTTTLVQETQERFPTVFERLKARLGLRIDSGKAQVTVNMPVQAADDQTLTKAPDAPAEEDVRASLTPRQVDILVAMLELDAVSEEKRKTTAAIRGKAEGLPSEQSKFKDLMAELARHGFVRTKTGCRGGCWLTPEGLATAREEQKRLDGDERTSG